MPKQNEEHGPKYHIMVDGEEYVLHQETILVAAIKELAGIPADIPLISLHEDGSEETLRDDEVIELKPGRRFARMPRFKRG